MVAEILGVDGIIVIVAVVIVLLFGGSKLPKLARSLGSASHEFKKGVQASDPDAALPLGSTSTDAAAVKSSERLDV
jgi:sec-independent protein translocase protein TatA